MTKPENKAIMRSAASAEGRRSGRASPEQRATFGRRLIERIHRSADNPPPEVVYGDLTKVRVERDRSGLGEVLQVFVGNVAVWTWAPHIDGPLAEEALHLFEALERWVQPPASRDSQPDV